MEVDDDAITKMVDWDRPLSEQTKQVREAFASLGITDESVTGGEAYNRLARDYAMEFDRLPRHQRSMIEKRDFGTRNYPFENVAKQSVSRALMVYGIPGIKYYDSASRSTGRAAGRAQQGLIKPLVDAVKGTKERARTRNYVVFDKKYLTPI